MALELPKLLDTPGPHSNIPAGFAEVVVPGNPFSSISRGIYVAGTGNVSAVMAGDGATVIFTAVPAGSILPIRATEITTGGTSATGMIVLW